MKIRFSIIIGGAILAFLFVIYALYGIQIQQGEKYAQRAQAQQAFGGVLVAPRGGIFITDKDNSKIPAALGKEYQVIYAVPAELDDVSEAASQIAELLSLDVDSLTKKLS